VLKYLRHAGIYGQPAPPTNNLMINNMTVVPLERLTHGELDFNQAFPAKDGAIPIEAPKADEQP